MGERSGRMAVAAALAGALVLAGGDSLGQVKPGTEQGLGLTGADVPPLLAKVEADPYRAPAPPACKTIAEELLALNAILGPDVDAEAAAKKNGSDMVGGAIRGLVPYGGVVRFLTGARKKDRALMKAVMAGYARRGFLRGVEAGLTCAAPTPPTPDAGPAAAPAPTPPSPDSEPRR